MYVGCEMAISTNVFLMPMAYRYALWWRQLKVVRVYERASEIERDRETERQRDRGTERQRDRETERQRERDRGKGGGYLSVHIMSSGVLLLLLVVTP